MRQLLRPVLYLLLAVVAYLVALWRGNGTGVLTFLGAGVLLELAFWFSLFDAFGRKAPDRSES